LDFPDPTPNPGGPGGSFSWSGHGVPGFPDPDNADGAFDLGNLNRSSPQYQSAFATCVSLTGFKGPMRVDISHQGA
jgi:hypothetical protein